MEAARTLDPPITVMNTKDLLFVNGDSKRKNFNRVFEPNSLKRKLDPEGIHVITLSFPEGDGAYVRVEIMLKLKDQKEAQRDFFDMAWEHYNGLAKLQKINGEWVRV